LVCIVDKTLIADANRQHRVVNHHASGSFDKIERFKAG